MSPNTFKSTFLLFLEHCIVSNSETFFRRTSDGLGLLNHTNVWNCHIWLCSWGTFLKIYNKSPPSSNSLYYIHWLLGKDVPSICSALQGWTHQIESTLIIISNLIGQLKINIWVNRAWDGQPCLIVDYLIGLTHIVNSAQLRTCPYLAVHIKNSLNLIGTYIDLQPHWTPPS